MLDDLQIVHLRWYWIGLKIVPTTYFFFKEPFEKKVEFSELLNFSLMLRINCLGLRNIFLYAYIPIYYHHSNYLLLVQHV